MKKGVTCKVVIFIILSVIIILYLIGRYPPNKNSFSDNEIQGLPNHSPISPYVAQQVAVVGNGPISENDSKKINECQCIIRFNDAKNRKSDERTDLQIVRRQLGVGKIERMFWKYFVPKGVYTMYVTEPSYVLSYNGLENPLGVIDIGRDKTKFRDDLKLFPGCNKCDNKPCTYSLTEWGPSTGALVINMLESMDNIKEINVFGMNWNPPSNKINVHVDFNYPELIKNCCKKCIIHKTTTNNYTDLR